MIDLLARAHGTVPQGNRTFTKKPSDAPRGRDLQIFFGAGSYLKDGRGGMSPWA
ncbi:hypothetical protein [Oricola sp.]|uniref:hypothetical protein n=1 Tax=Oricola sp. TaxID=1979950 RepID=UPI0025E30535|nr:hypothetical protein [Oricola sp.]MCI5077868.1 hypothetical protein [Oricola sp.]